MGALSKEQAATLPTLVEANSQSNCALFITKIINLIQPFTTNPSDGERSEPQFVNPVLLDKNFLDLLPINVREHAQKYGVMVNVFGSQYIRKPSNEDLYAIATSIFHAYAAIKGMSHRQIQHDEVKLRRQIKRDFNLDNCKNDEELQNVIAAFGKFIEEDFVANCVDSLAGHSESEKVKFLKRTQLYQKELEILTQKSRPLIINLARDGKGYQITAEFPYTTDETGAAVTPVSYKRDATLANAAWRIHGHVTDEQRVKIDSQGFRSANFVAFDKNTHAIDFQRSCENLHQYLAGASVIQLTQRLEKEPHLADETNAEHPIAIQFDQISLLSMLHESVKEMDPQHAFEQIMCVYHAGNMLNSHFRYQPLAINIPVNGIVKTLYVKPQFNLLNMGINSARYFTDARQDGINAGFFNMFLPRVAQELKLQIDAAKMRHIDNPKLEKLVTMYNVIFTKNAKIIATEQKIHRIWQSVQQLYVALEHATAKKDEKEIKNTQRKIESHLDVYYECQNTLLNLYKENFVNKQDDIKETLAAVHEELFYVKPSIQDAEKNIYDITNAMYNVLYLYFNNKHNAKQNNGWVQDSVEFLAQQLSDTVGAACNDGEDRTGLKMLAKKSREVFEQKNRFYPRISNLTDREQFNMMLSQQQHVDASQENTHINGRGAFGLEVHERDGFHLSKVLKSMAQLAKRPFNIIHGSHASGLGGMIKKKFEQVKGRFESLRQEENTDYVNRRSGASSFLRIARHAFLSAVLTFAVGFAGAFASDLATTADLHISAVTSPSPADPRDGLAGLGKLGDETLVTTARVFDSLERHSAKRNRKEGSRKEEGKQLGDNGDNNVAKLVSDSSRSKDKPSKNKEEEVAVNKRDRDDSDSEYSEIDDLLRKKSDKANNVRQAMADDPSRVVVSRFSLRNRV